MKEVIGDFWEYYNCNWKCIPTNLVVKDDGRAVMGAGLAKAARDKFFNIDLTLGRAIKDNPNKNILYLGTYISINYYSFPTKNNWRDLSNFSLIEKSAIELKMLYDNMESKPKILLPKVGCGLGGLNWKDVKKILVPIFDNDDFIIISQYFSK